MAVTVDYSTDIGKVRLLISDVDTSNIIFTDAQIDAFLDLALGNNVKRAAAQALRTIAASEVYVQKAIRVLDLQTDGAAVAREFRQQARDLMDQADMEEASEDGAGFDFAEIVVTPQQWDERLYKEDLRDG